MTEDDARDVIANSVSRETFGRLERYVALLIAEATEHNLISAATIPHMWHRHILDSAQLISLDPAGGQAEWIDVGSGAGLPGMVVAITGDRPVSLIEPRALRVRFLEHVVATLGLTERVTVIPIKAQRAAAARAAVISARAVASIADLFAMAQHLGTAETRWILPRGRSAAADVAAAQSIWQADYQLVASKTDSAAAIVVATGVRRRTRR